VIDDTLPDADNFPVRLTWAARKRIFEAADAPADAMHRIRIEALRQASFSITRDAEPPTRRQA